MHYILWAQIWPILRTTGGAKSGGDGHLRCLFAIDAATRQRQRQRINNFNIEIDEIALRLVDGEVGTPSIQNNAFSFVGTAKFKNDAGALRQFRSEPRDADALGRQRCGGNGDRAPAPSQGSGDLENN